MAVPKVRDAVHHATAPRQIAAPKVRSRPVEAVAAAPCVVPLAPLGNGVPLALNELNAPSWRAPSNPFVPVGNRSPLTPGSDGSDNPDFPGSPSVIPEPPVWFELIFGFTLIGGSIRAAAKGLSEKDEQAGAAFGS
jgi:hypothetical protein